MSQYIYLLVEAGRVVEKVGHALTGISWLIYPILALFLFIDGIVYTLISWAFSVFKLMSQLNLSVLQTWFAPLIDRINAVIAVLVLFIIGYSLIQYLINPDKAADKNKAGGIAVIKNIAIASILLISYNFIFNVANEFTFLIVGTPEGYNFNTLNTLFGVENTGKDNGLLQRFIYGTTESDDEEEEIDFGRKLSISMLSSFLHGNEEQGLYDRQEGTDRSNAGTVFNSALYADEFNLIFLLPTLTTEIWYTVYYFPLLSTAIGAYIVYCLAVLCIDLGKRAFKLIILQILAPIAIVTVMKDGFSAKVWTAYIKALKDTYLDAFVKIGSAYFSFALISVAYNRMGELFSGYGAGNLEWILYIVIVISALKLSKDLPKLIDQIFSTHISENGKVGLGQFLTAAAGFAGGALIGGGAGLTTRFKNSRASGLGVGRSILNGLVGGADGALTGGFSGMIAGAKTKGEKISDFFKGAQSIGTEAFRTGSVGIGGYLAGFAEESGIGKNAVKQELAALDQIENRRNAYIKAQGKQTVAGGAITLSTLSSPTSTTGSIEFNYAKDKDSAVEEALMANAEYRAVKALAERGDKDGISDEWTFRETYKKYFDAGAGKLAENDVVLKTYADSYAKKYAARRGAKDAATLSSDLVHKTPGTVSSLRNKAKLDENTNTRGIQTGGKK